MAIIGRPKRAPRTSPLPRPEGPHELRAAKYAAPTTAPIATNWMFAMICSATFALSATLMFIMSMVSIIRSMPKVTSPPGSTLVIQSKNSYGTNGRSTSLFARYIRLVRAAVSRPPVIAPVPRRSFLIAPTSNWGIREYYLNPPPPSWG